MMLSRCGLVCHCRLVRQCPQLPLLDKPAVAHLGIYALILLLQLCLCAAEIPGSAPSDELLGQWVAQLGDDAFATREEASAHLRQAGPAILERLKIIQEQQKDPEIVTRLKSVCHALREEQKLTLLRARRLVEELGGKLENDALTLEGPRIGDAELIRLAEILPQLPLKAVSLAGSKITDATLKQFSTLTKIEKFDLSRTAVTDEGLQALAHLTELRCLGLSQTSVTGAGLEHLPKPSKLEKLEMLETTIKDADCAIIVKFSSLKELRLCQTKITDAGLAQFGRLRQLERLFVVGTGVTSDGAAALKKTLPALNITE